MGKITPKKHLKIEILFVLFLSPLPSKFQGFTSRKSLFLRSNSMIYAFLNCCLFPRCLSFLLMVFISLFQKNRCRFVFEICTSRLQYIHKVKKSRVKNRLTSYHCSTPPLYPCDYKSTEFQSIFLLPSIVSDMIRQDENCCNESLWHLGC